MPIRKLETGKPRLRTGVPTTGPGYNNQLRVLPFRPVSLGRLLAIALISCLLCVCSAAQQDPAGASPNAPSASQQTQPQPANPMQSGAQIVSVLSHRSLVFPDLATDSGPLSTGGKFKLFVNNSVSLSSIVAAAGGAGVNQALDSPAGYGQGGEGYAKRFGSGMARNASSEFFGTFLLASALRQDPRFFVRNNLNFGDSIKYSIHRVFFTRGDSGNQEFNWSGLMGPLAAEGLANVYFPNDYRTVGNTFSRYGYDLGWQAAANLLRQYWPRINRKLKLVPQQSTSTTQSGPSSGATKP